MADRYDYDRERMHDRDREFNRDWGREHDRGREEGGRGGWRDQRYGMQGDWGRESGFREGSNRGNEWDRPGDFRRENFGEHQGQRGYGNEGREGYWNRDREDWGRNEYSGGGRGNEGSWRGNYGGSSAFGQGSGRERFTDRVYGARSTEFGNTGSNTSGYGGSGSSYSGAMGDYSGGTGSYGGGMGNYGGGMGSYGERGRHSGRGPKSYKRSDDRIREDVNERLTQHPEVDASEIEVEVKDGVVTLTGTVDERISKRTAEDVAESVSGVKDVHNQIRVQQRESAAMGSTGQHQGAQGTQSSSGSSGSTSKK